MSATLKKHSSLEKYFLNKRTERKSMLKLKELGWKKYRLTKYFIKIIICIVATSCPVELVSWGFKNGSGLMPLSDILIKTTVTIVLAIILLRLLIDKYKNSYGLPLFNIMSVVFIIMQ